jgi:hypothetical protein
MFMGKAKSELTIEWSTCEVLYSDRLWPYLPTLDLAAKVCQGETL